MELTARRPEDLPETAEAFLKAAGTNRVFAFEAPMGAGKTTFITEVCRRLGVGDDCASPTFSILNEYSTENGSPVYHFDFYRLESPAEAVDMGAEDYFYSGHWCLIEWPGIVAGLLPEDTVTVTISVNPDGSRTFRF